jgi:hypothetical protein
MHDMRSERSSEVSREPKVRAYSFGLSRDEARVADARAGRDVNYSRFSPNATKIALYCANHNFITTTPNK